MIFNYLIFDLVLMKSIFIQGYSPCGSTFKNSLNFREFFCFKVVYRNLLFLKKIIKVFINFSREMIF